jgi:hypothetical protein
MDLDKRGLFVFRSIYFRGVHQDFTVSTKPNYFFFYLNIPQLNCNEAEKVLIIPFLIENVTKEN